MEICEDVMGMTEQILRHKLRTLNENNLITKTEQTCTTGSRHSAKLLSSRSSTCTAMGPLPDGTPRGTEYGVYRVVW